MLLTIFLAVVFCAAMAMMLISCVAFIQDNKFFGSAPKEAREVIIQKEHELFYGARAIGWTLFIISVLMILGVGVIAVWDGFRSGFTFQHYYPEAAQAMEGRKYGFNIVSQLLKLFVIFPAVSALAAWICTLF